MAYKVGLLLGSLRKNSLNRKLAKAIVKLAPDTLTFDWIKIEDLSIYNDDLQQAPPEAVTRFKREVEACDALLFVSPEYNRSISSPLKAAIDWGSRPWGKNSFAGKPAAIAGASNGNIGTAPMQLHLRGVLGYLDVHVLGQPEVYIKFTDGLIDDDGNVTADDTRKFLEGFVQKFAAHVSAVKGWKAK